MKRLIGLALLAVLLVSAVGCAGDKEEIIDLSGTQLELSATSEFFDTVGNHLMTYNLQQAVLQDDGNIVFVHTFTNHSDYRVTHIVCEFMYYTSDGSMMAHKQLTKLLNETPVEPGGTYVYYSTNNFDGAVPAGMEARITRADTEFETPVLPAPNTDSPFFDFYTDGRYDGLATKFVIGAPDALLFTNTDGSTITVTDKASIKAAYDAMCKIQVGQKADSGADGKKRVYTFILSDGTEYTVTFEGSGHIRYGDDLYTVTGAETLYGLALKEEAYSQQAGDDYERGQVN